MSRFRPEYDPHTGQAFAEPDTYRLVPFESAPPAPGVAAREDDTPVRRKGANPSEVLTSPKRDVTRPARQTGTTMLPASYDVPENVPIQPTVALDAPKWSDVPKPDDMVEGVTTALPSAELEAAEPDEIFDRVVWVADRLTSCADALGADGRPRTALLLRGLSAGMTMGANRTALERVGARLVQRALLADAGVAEIDDESVARLLMDVAADVLVGVDPVRKASREIAHRLDDRAAECRAIAQRCREAGNALGVEHHTARADELAVQAREIRKANR